MKDFRLVATDRKINVVSFVAMGPYNSRSRFPFIHSTYVNMVDKWIVEHDMMAFCMGGHSVVCNNIDDATLLFMGWS